MKKIIISSIILFYSIASQAQLSLQWQRTFGGSLYDYTKETSQTNDGGYISVGYTGSTDGDISFSHGNGDFLLIKSDSSGTVQWKKTYGGTDYDYGYSVQQTPDGGFIAVGYSESYDGDIDTNNGQGDCWIIKTDVNGVIEWQKTVGGSMQDNAQCVRMTSDGGYIICGYSESSDGDIASSYGSGDCLIFKLNSFGTLEWEKTIGGSAYDLGQDIKATADGGYILTGGTHSLDGDVTWQKGNGDFWIVKLGNTGTILWEKTYGGSAYDYAQSIEICQDGGYVMTGYSESSDGDITGSFGNGDCWVVKCNNLGILEWQKILGSTGNDYSYCIKQLPSNGFVLTGYSEMNDGNVTNNHGNYDCWVVELDQFGFLKMEKSFGGTGVDIGYSIIQTSSGNYTIAGYSESNDGDVTGNHGGGDCWLLKLNLSITTNVEDNKPETIITIFPNPSNGIFHFTGLQDEDGIEIFDISGKLIIKKEVSSEMTSIDMSGEARGVYFCRQIKKNGERTTQKLILN